MMAQEFSRTSYSLNCRGRLLSLDLPRIMGILNATPDSFFSGSRTQTVNEGLRIAERMMEEGVSIFDIGGQSTRPGAVEVSEAEEMRRVIPFIQAVVARFPDALISIDTYHAKVAYEAVMAGASIINDISSGKLDPLMLQTVAQLKTPYIAMHMQGKPRTMQQNPQYRDVVSEVFQYLLRVKMECEQAGISDLVLDPGFGFGKTLQQNYQLLKKLPEFHLLGAPILVGVSRKSMIRQVIHVEAEAALNGTTVLHTLALQAGAQILRVHDVKEARETVQLLRYYEAV